MSITIVVKDLGLEFKPLESLYGFAFNFLKTHFLILMRFEIQGEVNVLKKSSSFSKLPLSFTTM
jgi:hypothetical protein